MQLISLIKDFALTVAALVGIWAAINGINAWKKQLKGQDEYSLAKRILRLLYKYESAAAHVRDPFVWEWVDAKDEAPSVHPDSQNEEYAKVYNQRAKELNDIILGIREEQIEAGILWGEEVLKSFYELDSLNHDLLNKLRIHLYPKTNDFATTAIVKSQFDDFDLFWGSPIDEDAYTKALGAIVQKFESFLVDALATKT